MKEYLYQWSRREYIFSCASTIFIICINSQVSVSSNCRQRHLVFLSTNTNPYLNWLINIIFNPKKIK